jgi:uncharacterized damage-inducible protein DinB
MTFSDIYHYVCKCRGLILDALEHIPESDLHKPLGENGWSLLEQARHLAFAEAKWIGLVCRGKTPTYPIVENNYAGEGLETIGKVRIHLVELAEWNVPWFARLDDEELMRVVDRPDGTKSTVELLVWEVLSHELRHHGTISTHLRFLGHGPVEYP